MAGSRRSQPLPKGWDRTRRRILRRDGRICYVCGGADADEVDHIVPAIAGGGEDDANLAAIHGYPCHAQKTAREANRFNPKAAPRRRPLERHPGVK